MSETPRQFSERLEREERATLDARLIACDKAQATLRANAAKVKPERVAPSVRF